MSAHFVEFLAGTEEFVALGELADDLIWRMPPALVRCHVAVDSSSPEDRATESHNDWTTTTGSPHVDFDALSKGNDAYPELTGVKPALLRAEVERHCKYLEPAKKK